MANNTPISNYLGVPVYGNYYNPEAMQAQNPTFPDFSEYNQDPAGLDGYAPAAPVKKPNPLTALLKPAVGLGAAYGTNSLMGSGAAAALPSILPLATTNALPSIAPLTGSAATMGGAAGLTPGAATILGSETLGSVLPIAGIGLGGYQLYDTFAHPKPKGESALGAGLGGAGMGAGAGFLLGGPPGALLGAGIGALTGGGLGAVFGKDPPHPETTDRRTAIEALRQAGVVDGNRDINLGSSGSLHLGDPQQRSAYNIDLSKADPTSALGQTVGGVGPLAALIAASQNGQSFNTPDLMKRASDMAGLLANGAMATKNPLESAGALYKSFGLDRDTTYQGVAKLAEMGAIDPQTRDAWFAATDRMFNVRNPNAPAEDQARFDQFQQGLGRTPGQAIKFDGPSKLDLSSFFKTAAATQAPTPVGTGPNPAIPDAVAPTLMGQQAPRMSSKFAGPGSNISAALGAASMPQTPVQTPAQAPTASYFPSAPTNREEFGNMIAALSMGRTGPDVMRYFGGGKK